MHTSDLYNGVCAAQIIRSTPWAHGNHPPRSLGLESAEIIPPLCCLSPFLYLSPYLSLSGGEGARSRVKIRICAVPATDTTTDSSLTPSRLAPIQCSSPPSHLVPPPASQRQRKKRSFSVLSARQDGARQEPPVYNSVPSDQITQLSRQVERAPPVFSNRLH